jgi:hypothetical protein
MDAIASNQIAYKKRIGSLENAPVFEVGLIGGLFLVVKPKGSSFETLGAGSHRAVARHLAKKLHPKMEVTELAKGDWIDPSTFQHQLPKYENIVNQLNDAIKNR